jgi:hypothetical protein
MNEPATSLVTITVTDFVATPASASKTQPIPPPPAVTGAPIVTSAPALQVNPIDPALSLQSLASMLAPSKKNKQARSRPTGYRLRARGASLTTVDAAEATAASTEHAEEKRFYILPSKSAAKPDINDVTPTPAGKAEKDAEIVKALENMRGSAKFAPLRAVYLQ